MINVTCEVKTLNDPAEPNIRIHNHWNDDRLVEIEVVGKEKRIIVKGDDLIAAIKNCMNTNRRW